MVSSEVLGEEFPSRAGAAFNSREAARAAADYVMANTGIAAQQIQIMAPGDTQAVRKLEPDSPGIARTLVRSHSILGTAGLGLGLILAAMLILFDIAPFSLNPAYTVLVAAFLGATAGLLLGGLVTLRPDHDRLIVRAQEAIDNGKWFVLVLARDHHEEQRASAALENTNNHVVGTF